ncbi:hypothetical protein VYU27_005770, partial [Nannochloropsis oceanica]
KKKGEEQEGEEEGEEEGDEEGVEGEGAEEAEAVEAEDGGGKAEEAEAVEAEEEEGKVEEAEEAEAEEAEEEGAEAVELEGKEAEENEAEAEEDEDEAEEEVMGGPSEDCIGVTPVNSSCPGTAVGHVTSCGCTGVWSMEKLVPMIFGLVNHGKICGHSMCSVPADLLFSPPSPSPPGPVWAVRGLCQVKKPVKVARKTRTRNKG